MVFITYEFCFAKIFFYSFVMRSTWYLIFSSKRYKFLFRFFKIKSQAKPIKKQRIKFWINRQNFYFEFKEYRFQLKFKLCVSKKNDDNNETKGAQHDWFFFSFFFFRKMHQGFTLEGNHRKCSVLKKYCEFYKLTDNE